MSETLNAEAIKALSTGLVEQFQVELDKRDAALKSSFGDTVQSAIDTVLKRFEDEPALKGSGYVTPDGGTADAETKSFADFLTAVKRRDIKRLDRVYGAIKSVDGELGTSGGFLVPPQFIPTLMEAAGEESIIRSRAYRQPMSSRTLTIPALDQQRTYSAGQTAYAGGVQLQWTAEEGTVSETSPFFKEVNLEAWKLSGVTYVTNEMMADSAVGLESLLVRLFGRAVGYIEDFNFIQGDGVNKPLGITNAPAAVTSGSSTVTAANLFGMMSRLFPDSMSRAVWIAHISQLPTIYALQNANNSLLTFLPDLRGKPGAQLLGLPLFFTDKAPGASAAGKVILADLSYYVVGDRQQMQVAMSEHAAFTTDRTAWRVVHRVDGQPWIQGSVPISASAAENVSAFVLHGA